MACPDRDHRRVSGYVDSEGRSPYDLESSAFAELGIAMVAACSRCRYGGAGRTRVVHVRRQAFPDRKCRYRGRCFHVLDCRQDTQSSLDCNRRGRMRDVAAIMVQLVCGQKGPRGPRPDHRGGVWGAPRFPRAENPGFACECAPLRPGTGRRGRRHIG
jgi:hypothetical protein